MLIVCAHCSKEADKPAGGVNRTLRNGKPLYCSRECSRAARRVTQHKPGWHEARFVEDRRKIAVTCAACETQMWLPPSKVRGHNFCDINCKREYERQQREDTKRCCETCGTEFYPLKENARRGGGRFCSQKCNTAGREALLSKEVQERAASKLREMRAAGLLTVLRGPDNPNWKGGHAEMIRRQKESGAFAANTRAYRKRSPDKVREFAQNRSRRKYGRLPRGTVAAIGEAQKWKCAICRTGIKKKYHVDHIMPLAKGGKHERANIQLLCPTCNVRKSAKDPIEYMQSLGRLL